MATQKTTSTTSTPIRPFTPTCIDCNHTRGFHYNEADLQGCLNWGGMEDGWCDCARFRDATHP
jgi:hypothetical protein